MFPGINSCFQLLRKHKNHKPVRCGRQVSLQKRGQCLLVSKQESESKNLNCPWQGGGNLFLTCTTNYLWKEWREPGICCDSKAARSHVTHLLSMHQHASITNGRYYFWLGLAKTWEQVSYKSTFVGTLSELWCGQAKCHRCDKTHSVQLNSIRP